MTTEAQRALLGGLADLTEYPRSVPIAVAHDCTAVAAEAVPEAGKLIGEFEASLEPLTTGELQELYTQAFDLEATWHPYVGYHIFGETYQRSQFLVGLKERYRAYGFEAPEAELADHISVLMRFLAVCDDDEVTGEIVTDALEPMLTKMTRPKKRDEEGGGGESPCASCSPELTGDEVAPDPRPDAAPDLGSHLYMSLIKGLKLVIDDIADDVRRRPAPVTLRTKTDQLMA